ncbi:site-specific integrase [Marinilabilia salmonicolor]|uniref:site-specific integrase n=1 Tax=Marinilabilia salmonicolor TaxID=989 RepID=UPI00029A3AEF|nr:site-specific integrase [Marinilabilia salmonicolor]
MSSSFSIKFYLNKNKGKGEQFKIYGRLIHQRKKSEFATNYYIEEDKWDEARGRAKRNQVINDELSELEAQINRIRRKLLDDEKPISSRIIVEILKGDRKEKRSLLEYTDEHIKEITHKKEHAENTLNHYKSSRNIYAQFIKDRFKRSDVTIHSIDYDFLKRFDDWMLSDYTDKLGRHVKRNTVNKHHSRLRTLLHKAVREGFIHNNPYRLFSLKNTPTNRAFLTIEEVNNIKSLDFSNNISLERVRDVFLFSCYTSLRFSDALNLKLDDIINTEDGKRLISIQMGKTKENVYVPVIPPTQEIIDKYEEDPARKVEGSILPRYSNQKLNIYLKMVATMAGINKKMTHHVARHTFATIALNRGMPLEVVQKILGHRNIRTTQIYAKMQTSTLEKEMQKFTF